MVGRYAAPEVLRNEEYDTKVDVFSFALILQEVKGVFINYIIFVHAEIYLRMIFVKPIL